MASISPNAIAKCTYLRFIPDNAMDFNHAVCRKNAEAAVLAVVFTSVNAPGIDHSEHVATSDRLVEIAQSYDGYLGIEPARNGDGSGVSAIYFRDIEAITAWARDPTHVVAKRKGRETWYSHYMIRICKVERDYGRPDWPLG